MIGYSSLIHDLEEAIAAGPSEQRAATLSRVTDLFLNGASSFSEEQIALFDDVIGRLAAEIEVRARAKLASRLARLANAPPRVVRSLAFDDDIEVAEPVLRHSPALAEGDLVGNAQTKGPGHLLAISRRASLSEAVTDVLVMRGDRQVVRTVAQNHGARFSNAGFRVLVKRSTGDDVLTEQLGLRPDIPHKHFLELVERASGEVKKKLLAAQPRATDQITQVLSEVVEHIRSEVRNASRDYSDTLARIEAQWRSESLDESHVYGFAKERKFEETTAALAVMSGLPIDVAERAMLDDRADLLLILAKAAEFSWTTVKLILLMRGAGGVSVQNLESALRGFERLQVATAKRVVEFYRTREGQSRKS